MLKRIVTNICLCILPFITIAQNISISGTVSDARQRSPLAFVSVSIKQTNRGVATDIDGKFSFVNVPENAVLVISHTGYVTKEISIAPNQRNNLIILIDAAVGELEAVVITSGENPANRIIRLVQANRNNNDPEHLSAFRYNAYTVAALGAGSQIWQAEQLDSIKLKTNNVKQKAPAKIDTFKMNRNREILERFKQNYLLITESYTERIFRYPRQTKETVLATKISGLKSPSFAFTTSNFQPFGFYPDFITMLDQRYVNPIVKGSLGMYAFKLLDFRIHDGDTTFIIAFEPKRNTRFAGLKGLLHINSFKYAIEHVIASPAAEKGLIMRFRLQQKYERNGNIWFPTQLNCTILQTDVKTDALLAYWDTRSYISNIVTGQHFTNADFSDLSLDYAPDAGKKPETDWKIFRTDSLKEKEKNTYDTYKLLPIKSLETLDKFNQLIEVFALEAIPKGKIDIPLRYFLAGINKYEKFRLGGGFQTNPLFDRKFSFGGFAGYGFGDKAFKYGGNIHFKLAERTATSLSAAYSRDLAEPGNISFFVRSSSVVSNESLRNFYTFRLDSVEQLRIDVSTKIRPFLTTSAWALSEIRNPAGFDYEFKNETTKESFRSFRNTEIGLGMRFTIGERFTKIGRAKIVAQPTTTELLVQFAKSLQGIAGGKLNYTNIAIQFSHQFHMKQLGTTSLMLAAGKIWGDVPYSFLFNGRSAKAANEQYLFIPNRFQTAGLYEFSSDQSVSLFLQHNFESLLLKPKSLHFRPAFVVVQAISYGSLQQKNTHRGIMFNSPTNGLLESGLLIKNIYRYNMQFAYIGLGIGVFHRYGYYRLPKAIDNWAFKLALTVSF